MSEFAPVLTLADLDTLDAAQIVEGYRAGRDGDPEPGNNRSRAFWHGWRNGRVDGGHDTPDDAQRALAAAYVAKARMQ